MLSQIRAMFTKLDYSTFYFTFGYLLPFNAKALMHKKTQVPTSLIHTVLLQNIPFSSAVALGTIAGARERQATTWWISPASSVTIFIKYCCIHKQKESSESI